MLFHPQLLFLASLCLAQLGVVLAQNPATAPREPNEAEQMLSRGDSLFESNRPVAALAMYRGAEERSFDPCQVARARLGIAHIHVQSQNPTQAEKTLRLTSDGLLACSAEDRLKQSQLAADLWMQLQQEARAISILTREIKLRPEDWVLKSKIAELHFISGNWDEANRCTLRCLSLGNSDIPKEKRLRWLSQAIQLDFITEGNRADSLTRVFETSSAQVLDDLAQDCREQIQMIVASEGHDAESMEWAKRILNHADRNNPADMSLAQLRVANAAQRLHRPLDVIIALHEGVKEARLTTDEELLLEALRQRADFEHNRGNEAEALAAMMEVDEINMRVLAELQAQPNREVQRFTERILPEPDPFDRAVIQMTAAQSSSNSYGLWPWLAALLSIGLLANTRSHRVLQEALRKERRRIIRLRSLVPSDRLPKPQGTAVNQNSEDANLEWGSSSLMPNGNFVFERDEDLRSQSIQTFLNALDDEIQAEMNWTMDANTQFSVGPDVRVVIRNFMRGLAEISNSEDAIRIEVEAETSHWHFCLSSNHTEASKAMQGLFHGKDALASSRWNELHAQLRKIAGKIQVERISPVEEKVTLTLPFA
jgi:tetratricopeptide (TPR) repeat protein